MNLTVLEQWFAAGLAPEARAWLAAAMARLRQSGQLGEPEFGLDWSACGRRLGRALLDIKPDEANVLRGAGAPFVPLGWGADELGRGLLLLLAARGAQDPAAVPAAVDELFRMGEMREQQAVLRVLAYLPGPERFVALAADAVRSNVTSVIEALACENPFPAAHIPEPAFNQMVMKCLFNQVGLGRVWRLAERNNRELRRIVGDYVSERRAAGRPVPTDVDLILST